MSQGMGTRYFLFAPVCILLLTFSGSGSAEIYKWVDDKGRVHFGDAPTKNQAAEAVQLEVNTYESVTYEDVEFAEPVTSKRVIMYSTSWCGYCTKARDYFAKNNIAFTDYDIETNDRARRAYDRLGGKGVPVILVGKKRMNGFSVKGFQRIYK